MWGVPSVVVWLVAVILCLLSVSFVYLAVIRRKWKECGRFCTGVGHRVFVTVSGDGFLLWTGVCGELVVNDDAVSILVPGNTIRFNRSLVRADWVLHTPMLRSLLPYISISDAVTSMVVTVKDGAFDSDAKRKTESVLRMINNS